MTTRCVFDIECVGMAWDDLDTQSQHDLTRSARTPEEAAAEKERLALYPATGHIVAIAMLNPDTHKGKILYRVDTTHDGGQHSEDDALYVPCGDEKTLLELFWQDIRQYDQIISFNGRGFDAPYILFRSMVHNLVPSRDLMPNRYGDYRSGFHAHVDLADQLSYYGAMRRFSLHVTTVALGIVSPKKDGVDGLAVPRLYADGAYETIARYCLRDVVATAELWRRWSVTQVR